jgi:predicted dehydrogenase
MAVFGGLMVTGGRTHQENYALGFQADARCRVVAVSDEREIDERRLALNRQLAQQLGVPYIADLGEALRRDDVHFVSICTEHERQGRVSLRCAEAGKHLYLDKPLAGSLGEARQLERVARERKLVTQMFTQLNFPYAIRAARLVRSGKLGELKAIHSDLFFAKGYTSELELAPRAEKAEPRAGEFLAPDAKRELFNIAIYSLTLIRHLTGRRRFETVRALTGNFFLERNKRRDMEDFGALMLRLEGGVTATIASGRTGWYSHAGGGHNRTRLVGTRGSATIDGWATRGEITSEKSCGWRVPAENGEDPMAFWASSDQRKTGVVEWFLPAPVVRSDQAVFVDCLEGKRQPLCTVSDGVAALEVLFAAYRSAATGREVTLRQ